MKKRKKQKTSYISLAPLPHKHLGENFLVSLFHGVQYNAEFAVYSVN